ncbi:MAG: hypothetical protein C0594_10305 [Marinilabiliales bacterium]|nr:MAG: hypothetical protein C0594_10305 [Marinilabiliales bacterium]
MKKYFISCLLLFIISHASFSQTSYYGYEITNFDTLNSDIPSLPVYNIVSDNNGTVWMSYDGAGGLTKFDGTNWTSYTLADGLPSENIFDMDIDNSGNLWIATDAGVAKYDGNAWTTYTSSTVPEILTDVFTEVEAYYNGKIWFGNYQQVLMFDGVSTWTSFTDVGLPTPAVNVMESNAYGTVWIANDMGVAMYDGTWTAFDTLSEPNLVDQIYSMAVDYNENLYVGSANPMEGGVSMYDIGNNTWNLTSYIMQPGDLSEIYGLGADNMGHLWIGRYYWGLYKYDGMDVYTFTTYEGLMSTAINNLYVDNNNIVWLATEAGISKLEPVLDAYLFQEQYASCGLCDAIIGISSNVTGDYSYNWSNGSSTGSGQFTEFTTISNLCTGDYFVTITDNTGSLDPIVRNIKVKNQPSSIEGTIYSGGNQAIDLQATVCLFDAHPGGVAYTLEQIASYYNGSYNFYELQQGNYYIKVIKDSLDWAYPNDMSTYYGDTFQHSAATMITLGCNENLTGMDINMQSMINASTGTGLISGQLRFIPYNKSTQEAGDPVPGAEVYIEQEPNDEPCGHGVTDTNGNYSFNSLADTAYTLYIDIPGVNMVSTYENIQIDANNQNHTGMNFYVDTLYGYGISTDSTLSVSPIKLNNMEVSVFPNPYSETVNIQYKLDDKQSVQIDLLDANGRQIEVLIKSEQEQGEYKLQYQGNINGLFFIRMQAGNTVYLKKVIKLNY